MKKKLPFKSTFHGVLAAALLTPLCTLPASASTVVISADFQPNAPNGPSPVSFTGVESQAATANAVFSAANIWNHPTIAPYTVSTTTNPSFSNLVNSAGTATNVGLSFTGTLIGATGSTISSSTSSDAVQDDYFGINSGGASSSVGYTISGLPANTSVTMFLYAPNFYTSFQRGFSLTANGTSVTLTDNSSTTDTALLTVTSNASGVISGTWGNIGEEGDWSGMQLAYNTVPEPGSAVFLGLGTMLLGVRRRRNARA